MRTIRHVRRPARRAHIAAVAMAAGLCTRPAAAADNEPEATPYRPTVAAAASISRPGWLEMELGGLRTGGHDTDLRSSLPTTFKYAFNDDLSVLVGHDMRVRSAPEGGVVLSGAGDTVLTLKSHFATGREADAFGLEAAVKLPTAKAGIGSGSRDYSLNGIYSTDLPGDLHLDLNLAGVRLGAVDAGQGRYAVNWAAALAWGLGAGWTLAGELSGNAERGAAAYTQTLAAISYVVTKRVVVDAGVMVGLSDAAPGWGVFSGVTVLLFPVTAP